MKRPGPKRHAILAGLGACLPARVVSNDDLAAHLDTSDQWIRDRTGIRFRHFIDPGMSTSDLAVRAGALALRSAGGGVGDGLTEVAADAVIVATMTPDRPCPATAPEVAARLELNGIGAYDVSAACSGFPYGLATAAGLIATGTASRVLLIGAETMSTIINPRDRTTAVIFADGAGAVLLRGGDADEEGAIGPVDLGSDGTNSDLIQVPGGGARARSTGLAGTDEDRYFQMEGKKVYRHAVDRMTAAARTAVKAAGWGLDDVDRLVMHQANARIAAAVTGRLALDPEKVLSNIAHVGNTSAASIPLLLAQAAETGQLRVGHRVLTVAFGAGLTWGATTFTWPPVTACTEVTGPTNNR
ncbi:MAG TPA: beta-ketoacyl-ACP synthase III [Streptosporangiaceae bacterium]